MSPATSLTSIVVLAMLAASAPASAPALAEATPTAVQCEHKLFKNLPGRGSFLRLQRQTDSTYTLETENHGKKHKKSKLTCVFHPDDARVFSCRLKSKWGLESSEVSEKSVDAMGMPHELVGFHVVALKSPDGAVKTESEMRFPRDTCTVEN